MLWSSSFELKWFERLEPSNLKKLKPDSKIYKKLKIKKLSQ